MWRALRTSAGARASTSDGHRASAAMRPPVLESRASAERSSSASGSYGKPAARAMASHSPGTAAPGPATRSTTLERSSSATPNRRDCLISMVSRWSTGWRCGSSEELHQGGVGRDRRAGAGTPAESRSARALSCPRVMGCDAAASPRAGRASGPGCIGKVLQPGRDRLHEQKPAGAAHGEPGGVLAEPDDRRVLVGHLSRCGEPNRIGQRDSVGGDQPIDRQPRALPLERAAEAAARSSPSAAAEMWALHGGRWWGGSGRPANRSSPQALRGISDP